MTTISSQAFGLDKKVSINRSIDQNFYDLRIGEPKLSPFPYHLLNQLHDRPQVNYYYPSHGDFQLREMILSRYYPGFAIDNIAITHGTMGALDFIMRAYLHEQTEILIPDPGFPPYVKMAELTHAKVVRYPLNLNEDKQFINWEKIDELITPKTKFILINSPHNPTGKILTSEDLQKFQHFLNKHPHVNFIMDEVYRDLIFSGGEHFDFSSYIERGFIVGSFSKMFPLQGARIGWVFTSAESMKKLSVFFNNIAGAMSSFGQELAKSILKSELSFTGPYAQALFQAKKILSSYHVDYVVPEGAFFICVRYQFEGGAAADELDELGVGVVSGEFFGESLKNCVRASFAQDKVILEKALTVMGRHWRQSHAGIIQ